MFSSYKKDILVNIIDTEGIVFGAAPTSQQKVTFAYANTLAKAVADKTDGRLAFFNENNEVRGIYTNGTLLTPPIQSITTAIASGAKHDGKTITFKQINANDTLDTSTFNVIDEAGLEAYFSGSKTIALNDTTKKYEVIVDNATIVVDDTVGINASLNIAYIPANETSNTEGAIIALRDKNNNILSSINVADIIGNGILQSATYDKNTNTLTLVFKQADGSLKNVDINMSELIDINDVFISPDSSIFLSATADSSIVFFGAKTYKVADASTDNYAHNGLATALDVKNYVDTTVLALDSTKNSIIESNDASVRVVQVDGLINDVSLVITPATVTYTAKSSTNPANLTGGTSGFVKGGDIATIKQYVDAKVSEVNSAVENLDASVNAWDASSFTTVGVGQVDGMIDTVNVQNTYAVFAATPGSITVTRDGIVTAGDLVDALNTALTWTILP